MGTFVSVGQEEAVKFWRAGWMGNGWNDGLLQMGIRYKGGVSYGKSCLVKTDLVGGKKNPNR